MNEESGGQEWVITRMVDRRPVIHLLSSAVVRVDPELRVWTAIPVPDGGNLRGMGEDVVDLYQLMSGRQ
ncbi:MAG: hypothetical protein B0D91_08880 [Oceanospirillales bacterium LUC14_002_19_P2]|nr:MAG: hypothetical protein B0D91_08880 [Oceanospirillales bacterium LUC14_002_19_P2]